MSGATEQQPAPGREGVGAEVEPGISGLEVRRGELLPGEALIDRIFTTVSASLARAGVEIDEVDSVILAADDVADGRSITTMMHATAAGAYFKDELRVTTGSLTALGLAGLRVSAGLSRRSIVASWWLPSTDRAALARTSVSVHDGARSLVSPARFDNEPTEAACAACVVGPASDAGELALHGFTWTQADFPRWLASDGEPEGVQRRLGRQLRERCGPFDGSGRVAASATAPGSDWSAAIDEAGLEGFTPCAGVTTSVGIADGLVGLSRVADDLQPGEGGVVLSTGSPQFLLAEAASVGRADA